MKTIFREKVVLVKFFTCLIGLLILTVLLLLKPAVNNTITKVYFVIAILATSILIVLFPLFYCLGKEKFYKAVFNISDMLSLFVVACCIFQLIFVFGVFKADVDGYSMVPTFNNGDKLLVRSSNHNLKNFDIIILEYDEELNEKSYSVSMKNKELIVKRLIGKPFDKLYIHNGVLYLNGKKVNEDYLSPNNCNESRSRNISLENWLGKGVSKINGEYVIDKGYYFVLGDNRDGSGDSRIFGLFQEKQIIGKVVVRMNSLFNWERVR